MAENSMTAYMQEIVNYLSKRRLNAATNQCTIPLPPLPWIPPLSYKLAQPEQESKGRNYTSLREPSLAVKMNR